MLESPQFANLYLYDCLSRKRHDPSGDCLDLHHEVVRTSSSGLPEPVREVSVARVLCQCHLSV